LSWLETAAWDVNAIKRRRLNYIDYYRRLADKYYSKGFPPAPFCKDVSTPLLCHTAAIVSVSAVSNLPGSAEKYIQLCLPSVR